MAEPWSGSGDWGHWSVLKRIAAGVVAVAGAGAWMYAGLNWVDGRWEHVGAVEQLERRMERRINTTQVLVLEGQLRDVTARMLAMGRGWQQLSEVEIQYYNELNREAEALRLRIAQTRAKGIE